MDSIDGNKMGSTLWSQITSSYNSTIEAPCNRISKQLKDRWLTRNQKITLSNEIYNRLYATRLSRANDDMLLEVAKESLHNKPSETGFKL